MMLMMIQGILNEAFEKESSDDDDDLMNEEESEVDRPHIQRLKVRTLILPSFHRRRRRGQRGTCPPPPSQKWGKYFTGN